MAETDRDSTGAAQGESAEEPPLLQRLFDNWWLLLAACIVVMFVFYTGWGLAELASLTQAPLP